MAFAENIKSLREMYDLSQAELGKIAGVTDKAVSTWESGSKSPRMGTIEKIAMHFGLKKSNLIEDNGLNKIILPSERSSYSPTHRIPILGNISAGLPLYAEEHIEGYTYTDLNHGEEYFALRVKGDSMTAARIYEGDTLIVRRQPEVEMGEIAVVLVDGDSATVKRFYRQGNVVTLVPQSLNPKHTPQIYSLKETQIIVLGKVVRVEINL